MYSFDYYLNEIPDAEITLRVNDTAMLEATLYDEDGVSIVDPDFTAMSAVLIVRRSDDESTDEISIAAEVDGDATDNIYFFDLTDIAYEPANLEAHIVLTATYEDTAATPIGPVTPIDLQLSFKVFSIEVLA